MAKLCRYFQRYFSSRGHCRALEKARANTILLTNDALLEEEGLPNYKRHDFFPVHVGMVFAERYKVLCKLGYGATSTVWFCRDSERECYIALKVCIVSLSRDGRDLRSRSEWEAHTRLASIGFGSDLRSCLRHIEARFTVKSPMTGAEHSCFVSKVTGLTLRELQALPFYTKLPIFFIKTVLEAVLQALDFLHTEARIVHTDIKPDNIFFTISDGTAALFAERLSSQWPVGKLDGHGDRINYQSVSFADLLGFEEMSLGKAVLGDLGEARPIPPGKHLTPYLIAPEQFRAPETILDMPWNHAVDMWSFAILTWLSVVRRFRFDARVEDGDWSPTQHLAQMVAIMGPPPVDYLRRSQVQWQYWDIRGRWKGKDGVEIPTSN